MCIPFGRGGREEYAAEATFADAEAAPTAAPVTVYIALVTLYTYGMSDVVMATSYVRT